MKKILFGKIIHKEKFKETPESLMANVLNDICIFVNNNPETAFISIGGHLEKSVRNVSFDQLRILLNFLVEQKYLKSKEENKETGAKSGVLSYTVTTGCEGKINGNFLKNDLLSKVKDSSLITSVKGATTRFNNSKKS